MAPECYLIRIKISLLFDDPFPILWWRLSTGPLKCAAVKYNTSTAQGETSPWTTKAKEQVLDNHCQ